MLSDRERKRLAAEMVECGEAMLDVLRGPVGHTPDPAAVAGLLARATGVVASMRLDFESPFGEHVATLDKAIQAAAISYYPTKVGTFDELEDAVEDARLYVKGVKDRARTVSTYWGGGVRGVWEERLGRVYIDADVGVLCNRFGMGPIAALFRLAAGANRVVSLLHLMHLNNQHHDDHDSVPFERNLNFAAMQLLGYLRELGVVVDDLKAAGMDKCLTNAAPLVALEEQRARWDATVKGLRDDIAFHLGHPDKTEPALEKLAKKGASLRLYETGTSNLRLHTSFSGGESLLLIASGMTTRDLRRIIDLSSTAWDVLMHSLEAIFRDLLVQVGARLPAHPEKAPEEAQVHWVCSGCPSRSLRAGCPGRRLRGGQAA